MALAGRVADENDPGQPTACWLVGAGRDPSHDRQDAYAVVGEMAKQGFKDAEISKIGG
jgi:hypothetical protein